jgi:CHAT domain-containing protein
MLLADGTLSLEQVGGLDLSRAELAFLSACQTAIGGVRVLDESVHLSAAFQLAGYRHVIGTMWAVADSLSAEVVAGIYDELRGGSGGTLAALDPGKSALAVHQAVRRLRDRYPGLPLRWIPYLHLGP